MSKNIYILLLITAVLFAGCGAPAGNDEDPRLVIWHWMGDRQTAFEELARRYEAETGTPVTFELYAPSEVYSQKVKASAQTRTLPDVFGILGDTRDFASFVKSGYVAELGALGAEAGTGDAWIDKLFQKAVEVNHFKPGNEYGVAPGLYGVPLDMTNVQLLYNRALFRQAGLDPDNPPQTWDAFLAASRTLRDADIPVLVSGFGEIWLIDILSTAWAMNLMGAEKVYDTYRGKVPYTDPDWVGVLELFKTLADEKLVVSGAVTMVNKTSEQTFANGRAAFAWNGSWCVNVYAGMNPDLDYAAVLPPRLTADHPVRIWGGAGNSLMINDQSPRRLEAFRFLTWLAARDQQIFFATKTRNLPANHEAVADLPPILQAFGDDLDGTFHLNTMPAHEFPRVMEAWSKGIQSILIGEKTPEEVAREVQALKERRMERQKRS